MSCQESLNASTSDEQSRLDEVVAFVAEEGFFASVEPVGDAEWNQLCAGHDTWLESHVRFHGPVGGALRCRLPLTLAHELVSAFLGMPVGELAPSDPLVEDLTGELANMLCGRWLTRNQLGQVFDLEHPVVSAAPEGDCAEWRRYAANGVPLAVELTFEAP